MADETLRGWGVGADNDGGDVPAVASDLEDWGLVSQHGVLGTDRIILRDGHLPTNTLLRDRVHSPTRTMAIPKSFRGCGLLR